MQEINLRLWRNHGQQNWSAETNGKRYESVAIELIEELMERALIAAEQSLIEATSRRPN